MKTSLMVLASLAGLAHAQPFEFTPLMRTGDILPDGSTYRSHFNQVTISGDFVAFPATSDRGDLILRINLRTGERTIIASYDTPSPSYPESNFFRFFTASNAGGVVLFTARAETTGTRFADGVYAGDGTNVWVVADELMTPNLGALWPLSDGTDVTFQLTDNLVPGRPLLSASQYGGFPTTFARREQPAPSGGHLWEMGEGAPIDGGRAAFTATVSGGPTYRALFQWDAFTQQVTELVHDGTPMPGSTGVNFAGFTLGDVEGDRTLFGGIGNNFPQRTGLYIHSPQGIERVVDSTTFWPGQSESLQQLHGAACLDGQDVLFHQGNAGGGIPWGVYLRHDGEISPVLTFSSVLDGLSVTSAGFRWQALDNGRAVIAVTRGAFQSFDIYLVTFDTPCAADISGASDPNDPAYGVPDGIVDSSDFFYYLDQFVADNLVVADLTGSSDPNDPAYGTPDGFIDASDFFYYLDLFVAGCP